MSLLQQLYVVALETTNPRDLRYFAARQLQRIGAENGIRQAILFAQTVFNHLENEMRTDFDVVEDSVFEITPLVQMAGLC